MSDLIERQVVLDAVKALIRTPRSTVEINRVLIPLLEDLPSAQPEPCEDAVSKSDALSVFEKACYPVRYDNTSIELGMTLTGIRQVLDDIPSVTPQSEQRWIPCSERLPELTDDSWVSVRGRYYSEPCLVTYKAYLSDEDCTSDITACLCDDGKWYWQSDDLDESALVPITAWMPLPEPYREDGE